MRIKGYTRVMPTRSLRSILLALLFAFCAHNTLSADRPWALICELPDGRSQNIVIEAFGGMSGAVHQCLFFWNGKPGGFER